MNLDEKHRSFFIFVVILKDNKNALLLFVTSLIEKFPNVLATYAEVSFVIRDMQTKYQTSFIYSVTRNKNVLCIFLLLVPSTSQEISFCFFKEIEYK